jgi:hypothetical protein
MSRGILNMKRSIFGQLLLFRVYYHVQVLFYITRDNHGAASHVYSLQLPYCYCCDGASVGSISHI